MFFFFFFTSRLTSLALLNMTLKLAAKSHQLAHSSVLTSSRMLKPFLRWFLSATTIYLLLQTSMSLKLQLLLRPRWHHSCKALFIKESQTHQTGEEASVYIPISMTITSSASLLSQIQNCFPFCITTYININTFWPNKQVLLTDICHTLLKQLIKHQYRTLLKPSLGN